MNYFSTLTTRLKNAIADKEYNFWIDLTKVILMGGVGVYLPYFFNWNGDIHFFEPGPWLTFGLGTLGVILTQRMVVIKNQDDAYDRLHKLVILVLVIICGGLFFKANDLYLKSNGSLEQIQESIYYVKWNFVLLITIWAYDFIGTNSYNDSSPSNILGGDL